MKLSEDQYQDYGQTLEKRLGDILAEDNKGKKLFQCLRHLPQLYATKSLLPYHNLNKDFKKTSDAMKMKAEIPELIQQLHLKNKF